jgi:hypothetical protein
MPPNPKTGFVTLPEVVTGELELDVSMGYRMRAGGSAIACGPLTP